MFVGGNICTVSSECRGRVDYSLLVTSSDITCVSPVTWTGDQGAVP